MSNGSQVFGQELLGRNYVVTKDIVVGGSIALFCLLQILFGSATIWIIYSVKIFHNAFGSILVTRTIVDICSSVLHIVYSSYVTISQRSDYSPLLGIVAAWMGYSFAAMSCLMHVLLAVNRFVSVYLPIYYKLMFRRTNYFRIVAAAVLMVVVVMVPFKLIPCNTIGYSAVYYGYIMLDCREPGQQRPFHYGRFLHITCTVSLCLGAILIDTATIVKLVLLKKSKAVNSDSHFRMRVRFTMQSFCQNIPMFIEVILLSFGDNSTDDSKALLRTMSFIVTRFTDFINSTAIIVFNPEARKFVLKRIRQVATNTSSTGPVHTLPSSSANNL
ncbi:hypothetical protein QR680_016390 [Steinernema hermaphroditum]|uniref:7TM GPCR serpentine receptor class x (Srx) domain-containing protein n=1 Tax=Steinernema hermaphroditum TaxID=289476 RepID=A0AA39HDJ6_9BILA|nr:hypothetical protein QR680_016390 [Steinernema hermaphroditum]